MVGFNTVDDSEFFPSPRNHTKQTVKSCKYFHIEFDILIVSLHDILSMFHRLIPERSSKEDRDFDNWVLVMYQVSHSILTIHRRLSFQLVANTVP